MIEVAEALEVAERYYPDGAETLADYLGVNIGRTNLGRCDGFCLVALVEQAGPSRIWINASESVVRQRFTLAHELAHLILGTTPEIRTRGEEVFCSDREEERAADRLASEILLPLSKVRKLIPEPPIDARTLSKLSGQAKVSELMTACRIAGAANDLGLVNATVVRFNGTVVKWIWSPDFDLDSAEATALFRRVGSRNSPVYRENTDSGEIITAFPLKGTSDPTMFVQRLPAELAINLSKDELRRWIFQIDRSFEASVSSCLGLFKGEAASLGPDEAMEIFIERYGDRWVGDSGKRIRSSRGRKFLRMRLVEWCLA